MLSAAFAENTNCFPKILLILLGVHCNLIYTVYETQIEWLKTRTFGDVATLRSENYRVLFRPVNIKLIGALTCWHFAICVALFSPMYTWHTYYVFRLYIKFQKLISRVCSRVTYEQVFSVFHPQW